MGLDSSLLVNATSIANEFICSVCCDITEPDAAVVTGCAHLYCRDCLKTCLQSRSSCPLCLSHIPFSGKQFTALKESNPVAYRILNRLMIRCSNSANGCGWQGELSDLCQHLSSCECQVPVRDLVQERKQLMLLLGVVPGQSLVQSVKKLKKDNDQIAQRLKVGAGQSALQKVMELQAEVERLKAARGGGPKGSAGGKSGGPAMLHQGGPSGKAAPARHFTPHPYSPQTSAVQAPPARRFVPSLPAPATSIYELGAHTDIEELAEWFENHEYYCPDQMDGNRVFVCAQRCFQDLQRVGHTGEVDVEWMLSAMDDCEWLTVRQHEQVDRWREWLENQDHR